MEDLTFNTPIEKNKWINAWLKDMAKTNPDAKIEMYNFKSEKEIAVKSINTAYSKIFPTTSRNRQGNYNSTKPEYSLTIPILNKTYYSESIPITVSDEIVELMCQYDIDNGLV